MAWDIAVDASGNSYVAGVDSEPLQGLGLITFWKVDTGGTKQWTRLVTGVYGGEAVGIAADPSGNMSVTGKVQAGTATFGAGEPNQTEVTDTVGAQLYVARYDASGNLIWVRQSPDQIGFGYGTAISTDAAGNSYVLGGGNTVLGLGEPNETAVTNAFVAKYHSLGHLAWATNVAPPIGQISGLFGIAHSAAGHTYITGTVSLGVIFIEKVRRRWQPAVDATVGRRRRRCGRPPKQRHCRMRRPFVCDRNVLRDCPFRAG